MDTRKAALAMAENLKKTYAVLSKIAIPVSARILKQDKDVVVEAIYSRRSVEMNGFLKFAKTIFFSEEHGNKCINGTEQENVPSVIYSQDMGTKATIFSKKEGEENKFWVQFFDNVDDSEIATYEVSASKKHGKIHLGPEFGHPRFSPCGKKLLYGAEKSVKSAKYFDASVEWNSGEKLEESGVGTKFVLLDNFGEQLFEVCRPILCILDVEDGSIEVLDKLMGEDEECCPLYSTFSQDGKSIFSFLLPSEMLKHGRIYCNNRPGKFIQYDIDSKTAKVLVDDKCIESIISSGDSKFVYYMVRDGLGAHNQCLKLYEIELESGIKRLIVDQKSLDDVSNDTQFPGFFSPTPARNPWSNDGKHLLFTCQWKCTLDIVSVKIETGEVRRLTNVDEVKGSWNLLDFRNELLIASESRPNKAPVLHAAVFPKEGQQIKWKCIESEKTESAIAKHKNIFDFSYERQIFNREGDNYEGILMMPNGDKITRLAVIPHGGPHGASICSMPRRDVLLLLNNGFACLYVNYHGSAGYGFNFIESLPGKCGTLEIGDVQFAKNEVLKKYPNITQTYLFGGSHGGYTVSHLIGQYPDDYVACAALNPVLDMQTTHDISDIADWAVCEALGRNINWSEYLTMEEREKLFKCSPIAHVQKVKTPYLLLNGEKDLRVVPHYRPFIRTLLANKVPCKVLTYPKSNHPLEEVEVEADYSINMLLWFNGFYQ
uniref:Peptidase_S9 domain-containing protein n=1 Tax=Rhabditophanes sp. KR3021 TaxID=114890 RepID=A0AC35TJ06_9BILA